MGILAWALQTMEFPRHDAQNDPFAISQSLGFLMDGPSTILDTPLLRPQSVLNSSRELMYAVHCRLRDVKRNPQRKDFSSWVNADDFAALNLGADRYVCEGDLAIQGRPASAVDPRVLQTCDWIVTEQHRATIWLKGEYQEYWQFSVDT